MFLIPVHFGTYQYFIDQIDIRSTKTMEAEQMTYDVYPMPRSGRCRLKQIAQKASDAHYRQRAAIEPVIGHLKSDHRLNRNFLKGFSGKQIHLLMATAAFNFRKWMRKLIFWLQNTRAYTEWFFCLPSLRKQ